MFLTQSWGLAPRRAIVSEHLHVGYLVASLRHKINVVVYSSSSSIGRKKNLEKHLVGVHKYVRASFLRKGTRSKTLHLVLGFMVLYWSWRSSGRVRCPVCFRYLASLEG